VDAKDKGEANGEQGVNTADDQAIQKLLNDHPAPPAGLGIAAISAPVLVTIMIPAPPVAARRARRARRHHPQPIHGH
jgi:hypothetical protein